MEKQARRRRSRRVRLTLVLGATVVTTGLVSFGGLAAWQAYTDNPDTVTAQSLAHANTSGGVACTSVTSTALLNQSGNVCNATIDVTASPRFAEHAGHRHGHGHQHRALSSIVTLRCRSRDRQPLRRPAASGRQPGRRDRTVYAATTLTTQMVATSLKDNAGASHLAGHLTRARRERHVHRHHHQGPELQHRPRRFGAELHLRDPLHPAGGLTPLSRRRRLGGAQGHGGHHQADPEQLGRPGTWRSRSSPMTVAVAGSRLSRTA